ncbi:hypothetical protein J8F10_24015 [Gemmata sp. G18]|uniref:Uncharacterized protein n=1 Tax=Gemmata palustris TaxID=2822762 RepID=A0ABS5BX60_9BACT|nr:phage holin, LLH family [Gemmata palustris]MBP3958326.1 hypothetical protein [Gemmata palustris]
MASTVGQRPTIQLKGLTMDILSIIKLWFAGVSARVAKALKATSTLIMEGGGDLLLDLAAEAVKAAEATGGSGEDKFKAAKKVVIKGLQQRGRNIVVSAIHSAIEMAVAEMKTGK